MTKRASDFFFERLKVVGVARIYGYSRDGIKGEFGTLQSGGERRTGSKSAKFG